MKFFLLLFSFLLTGGARAQQPAIYDLSCEHKINPAGINTNEPRLSWKIKTERRNTMQAAYEVRVSNSPSFSAKANVWESGKVPGDASVLVPYREPIEAGRRYYWQVKVWDNAGAESLWSEVAWWEAGITPADWKAAWIEPAQDTVPEKEALLVRKEFALAKPVAAAKIYITAHGLYQLYINGQRISDQEFTPGWTSYNKRLQYQVYDVTGSLQRGGNAVGVMLGDGWYKGILGWDSNLGIWGKKAGLLLQLKITYADGTEDWMVTDKSWQGSANSAITKNGIYYGEDYDARKEQKGWASSNFKGTGWEPVQVARYGLGNLIASESVPVKKMEERKPVRIFRTPKGTLVADMGQNMVGWVRLRVQGAAGQTVTLRHAEVLDKKGEFYTDNLRKAAAVVHYTLKGGGEESYEPHFTFMGFRYVAVDNYPGALTPESLTGVVLHSATPPTGSFVCSDPLLNQLQKNIVWGQKGNFLDVPTDCPQRDERLGWTGDAQAFCRTAAFNMNVAAFFTKWAKDIAADQNSAGQIPFVIPDIFHDNHTTSAGWGDVVTILPWTMYQVYGDSQMLQRQYPSMKAYAEYIIKQAGDGYIWKGGSIFGDWLYYKPQMENHTEPDGYTDRNLIATAFYAYTVQLLSKSAAVLNYTADKERYEGLFAKIKAAFIQNYVTPEGRVFSDSQTGYVLSLMFDLLPAEAKAKSAGYLVEDIRRRGNHLSTGFLGTPYLCHVLSQNGYTSVGYDLLLQQSFPSWLYPVKMGATTIWERWDGQKTDSSFQDAGMNSFNHYAYGAIGDWMYRVVAGIEIGQPGYKEILIQPHPDKRLQFAKADYESMYGTITSGWEMADGTLTVTVQIPANTTAIILLPNATEDAVQEGGKPLASVFKKITQKGADLQVESGSGTYRFEYRPSAGL